MSGDESVGVYLHVPFCERVCPYCDFAVVPARPLEPARESRTVDALLRELDARAEAFAGLRLESVYLGGGTPSLLSPDSVARLIDGVRAAFPGEPREVTLELNPSTVERSRLPGFRAAGVGRLSVGVQSFDDDTLRRLGRAHRAAEARATLEAARAAGFRELACDLIFGVAGQSPAAAQRDAEELLRFEPDHVSAYALTVEQGTPLARGVAGGQIRLPEEEALVAMMQGVRDRLEEAGLRWYEISSYARVGCEAVHNRRYWRRAPVLGLGMGAHSTERASAAAPHGARSANERSLEAWLARVESGGGARPPERERLSLEQARSEAAFLGLRTARGLRAAEFAAEFGEQPAAFYGAAIEELGASGHIAVSAAGDLTLTRSGWLLADAVCARFC